MSTDTPTGPTPTDPPDPQVTPEPPVEPTVSSWSQQVQDTFAQARARSAAIQQQALSDLMSQNQDMLEQIQLMSTTRTGRQFSVARMLYISQACRLDDDFCNRIAGEAEQLLIDRGVLTPRAPAVETPDPHV